MKNYRLNGETKLVSWDEKVYDNQCTLKLLDKKGKKCYKTHS